MASAALRKKKAETSTPNPHGTKIRIFVVVLSGNQPASAPPSSSVGPSKVAPCFAQKAYAKKKPRAKHIKLLAMASNLLACLLLVAMPGAPSSFLFLVVRPGALVASLLLIENEAWVEPPQRLVAAGCARDSGTLGSAPA